MENKTLKKIGVILLLLAVMCFTACEDESSSKPVLFTMGTNTGSQTKYVPQTLSDDEQVMLMFRCEPKGELAKKQDNTEYKVYYSGRVTDEKNGSQSKITGAELEKLKKYADDILNKKIKSEFDGGSVDLDTTVCAYDRNYKSNQLSAFDKCSIDKFDEMYKIVTDKFKG